MIKLNKLKTTLKSPKMWIATIILISGLYYIYNKNTPETNTLEYTVEKGNISKTLSATGKITSTNYLPIESQVSGKVIKVSVKNGEIVKQGQEIARIETDEESKQAYAQALASYQSASAAVAQAKNKMTSLEGQLIQAKLDFHNAAISTELASDEPEYKALKKSLEVTEEEAIIQHRIIDKEQTNLWASSLRLQSLSNIILAPSSGEISGLNLQVGSFLTRGKTSSGESTTSHVAYLLNKSKAQLTINVSQIDIPKLTLGQEANVKLDAFADKEISSKIIAIDTRGEVVSNVTNYPVTLELNESNDSKFTILPNMTGSAVFILEKKENVLLLPSKAIEKSQNESFVTVSGSNKTSKQKITTGLESNGMVEILDGLTEGTKVIKESTLNAASTPTSPFSPFSANRGQSGATTRAR